MTTIVLLATALALASAQGYIPEPQGAVACFQWTGTVGQGPYGLTAIRAIHTATLIGSVIVLQTNIAGVPGQARQPVRNGVLHEIRPVYQDVHEQH